MDTKIKDIRIIEVEEDKETIKEEGETGEVKVEVNTNVGEATTIVEVGIDPINIRTSRTNFVRNISLSRSSCTRTTSLNANSVYLKRKSWKSKSKRVAIRNSKPLLNPSLRQRRRLPLRLSLRY